MKSVKITVLKQTQYKDLMEKYENPIEHACNLKTGDVFISVNAQKPENLCDSAWESMEKFVKELALRGITIVSGMAIGSDAVAHSEALENGGNTIAEPTLTKAQKTFSTKDVNPNFPKPKTLYFVYFHLNPALESRIQYKNKFIKTLIESGNKDGMTVNRDSLNNMSAEVYSQLKSTLDKTYDSKKTSDILLNNNELSDKGLATVNETIKDYTAETATLDFIPTHDMFKTLSFEISKLVKNYDKPSVVFDTAEFNEYNRKRHIYTGVKYNDINISFYDVKESPVQQFFIAYLKFICSDFFCKSAGVWERPIENNHW